MPGTVDQRPDRPPQLADPALGKGRRVMPHDQAREGGERRARGVEPGEALEQVDQQLLAQVVGVVGRKAKPMGEAARQPCSLAKDQLTMGEEVGVGGHSRASGSGYLMPLSCCILRRENSR